VVLPRPAREGYALIDYEEFNGKDLDFYVDIVSKKPYKYGAWNVPHDAKALTLSTKRSTIEQLMDHDSNGRFVRWDPGTPLLRLSLRDLQSSMVLTRYARSCAIATLVSKQRLALRRSEPISGDGMTSPKALQMIQPTTGRPTAQMASATFLSEL